MNNISQLSTRMPESAPLGSNLPAWALAKMLRQNFAGIATSLLALTSAQAGPLTRENMPDAPVTFSSLWAPTTTSGNYFLNRVDLRVAGDESAEIFSTNWNLRFLDDGSIEMLLNTVEDDVSTPSFSTRFDRYEQAGPWIYLYYNGDTLIWSFSGWVGYNWISIGNMDETGIRFNEVTQTSNVPEPGSLPLVVGGLVVGAAWFARRRKEGEEVVPEMTPETVVWKPEEAIA